MLDAVAANPVNVAKNCLRQGVVGRDRPRPRLVFTLAIIVIRPRRNSQAITQNLIEASSILDQKY